MADPPIDAAIQERAVEVANKGADVAAAVRLSAPLVTVLKAVDVCLQLVGPPLRHYRLSLIQL